MSNTSLKNLSDQALVALLKKGDESALNEIFNRYWEKLFRQADRVLLSEDLSKDVVQEVFVSLWEKRDRAMIHNLFAYLIQSVKYKVVSQLRKGTLTPYQETKMEGLSFANSTEETINLNELNEQITLALEEVPERCREVFYLSRFEHLSNQQIADKLGISIRTVETQISRALKHLRVKLKFSSLWFLLF